MAMYIPNFVETPYQSPAPSFSPAPTPEIESHVPEIRDATAHLVPCIRKRPMSLLEDIPRDLYSTTHFSFNDY